MDTFNTPPFKCNCHLRKPKPGEIIEYDNVRVVENNYGYEDLVPKEEEPTVPHYDAKGKIRVWDFIADKELDFFEGNVVKYVCRSPYKGEQIADLRKAISYLEKKIRLVEGGK